MGRTPQIPPEIRAAGRVVGAEELFHPLVFQRLDPHLGDRRLGGGQEGAVVQAPAGEHGPDAGRFARQIRQELAPAADALTVILGAGVGDLVYGVQEQQERAAPQQLGQAGKPRVALRPLLCQPVSRRRRIAPGPRRAVAAEGEEEAERGIAARAAQGVQRQVQLQPAQQGALAAAGRAQQDQRRGIGFLQYVPEIVERLGPGLGLPAGALGLRPLVQQQGQAGETLVQIKAGLGPLGDAGEAVFLDGGRGVAQEGLPRLLVQLRDGASGSEEAVAESGQGLGHPGSRRRAQGLGWGRVRSVDPLFQGLRHAQQGAILLPFGHLVQGLGG